LVAYIVIRVYKISERLPLCTSQPFHQPVSPRWNPISADLGGGARLPVDRFRWCEQPYPGGLHGAGRNEAKQARSGTGHGAKARGRRCRIMAGAWPRLSESPWPAQELCFRQEAFGTKSSPGLGSA